MEVSVASADLLSFIKIEIGLAIVTLFYIYILAENKTGSEDKGLGCFTPVKLGYLSILFLQISLLSLIYSYMVEGCKCLQSEVSLFGFYMFIAYMASWIISVYVKKNREPLKKLKAVLISNKS